MSDLTKMQLHVCVAQYPKEFRSPRPDPEHFQLE